MENEASQRSEAWDNNDYNSLCLLAANNPKIFSEFRRSPTYRNVVETVNYWQGYAYLQEILKTKPEISKRFDSFRENDSIGNPEVYNYPGAGCFSGLNLRYIKVLSDLEKVFGSLDGLNIVEIGCGFGGQCNLILSAFNPRSYTLIDIAEVLPLINQFLGSMKRIDRVKLTTMDQLTGRESYDLILSNYAYTELSREVQEIYMEKVLSRSKRGYITYNYNNVSLPKEELLSRLPPVFLLDEKPLTGVENCIFVWGSKETSPVLYSVENKTEESQELYVSFMTVFEIAPLTEEQVSIVVKVRERAEDENAETQFRLAVMFHFGQRIERHDQEAFKWCQKAAEKNHLNAQKFLGIMYYLGMGTSLNIPESLQWFEKAAEQGHATTQKFLGTIYFEDKAVPQNYEKSVKWLRKAAENGVIEAQNNLASMYIFGYGVPKNFSEAFKWYQMAAHAGMGVAQVNLGLMYLRGGDGVPKNNVKAAEYFRMAAERGSANAKRLLESIKAPSTH